MNSPENLLNKVATELERARRLPPRVISYIAHTYNVDHDGAGRFLAEKISELEEYEVDLILSPVFTPKLADQAIFAELLGRVSIPADQWSGLIAQLVRRPTRAQLIDDGGTHSIVLQEVTIQRYVDRLRLDGTIAELTARLIEESFPTADRPMLKAIARRAVWDTPGRSSILETYLRAALNSGTYSIADAVDVLNTVETVKPTNVTELLAWIPRRKDTLREQIATGTKQFFSQNIQELHGGDRDQRSDTDGRMSAKESELEFVKRLGRMLGI